MSRDRDACVGAALLGDRVRFGTSKVGQEFFVYKSVSIDPA